MRHISVPTLVIACLVCIGCSGTQDGRAAGGCSTPAPAPTTNSTSRKLASSSLVEADPVIDLRRALACNDKRFIGISGFTRYAPAMEYFPELTAKFGVKYISDITDSSPQNDATVDRVVEYATIYNLLLFRTLRREHILKWEDVVEPSGRVWPENSAERGPQ